MYQVIEQLAIDTGLSVADANRIFTEFSDIIVNKIPQLGQVINDVFANADDDLLQEHVKRLSVLIQQQESDKHKLLQSPVQESISLRLRYSESGELF